MYGAVHVAHPCLSGSKELVHIHMLHCKGFADPPGSLKPRMHRLITFPFFDHLDSRLAIVLGIVQALLVSTLCGLRRRRQTCAGQWRWATGCTCAVTTGTARRWMARWCRGGARPMRSCPAAAAARLCGGRLLRWPRERGAVLGFRTAWNHSCAATAAARVCGRLQREPHERADVLAAWQHRCILQTTERIHGSAFVTARECYCHQASTTPCANIVPPNCRCSTRGMHNTVHTRN